MKKLSLFFLLCVLALMSNAQDILSTNNGTVSFFSHAPLEDIFAESKELSSAINTTTNKISVKFKIETLKMENSLQQEHLNEKYLESHKYPNGTFSGVLVGNIDWKKDGIYNVKAKGMLNVHGVEKEREVDAIITIKNGKVNAKSVFMIKVADHKVEIPKLVFQKVAEEVEIKINADYEVYVK